MSVAIANTWSKFSVSAPPDRVAVWLEIPDPAETLAAMVSRSLEICSVSRVLVPSRIIAAVY
jgi:hypothetical protein